MTVPFPDGPSLFVSSRDGTPIAIFSGGDGPGAPVLLVHGTGSDHTTWRAVAPLLAAGRRVHALDRRGRGASGDGAAYTAAVEADDVAAAAEAIAAEAAEPITLVGHSLGGRLALAAALRTSAIARVLAYEGAPSPSAGGHADEEPLLAALAGDLAAGRHDAVLDRFLRVAGGLPEDELRAFRASALWQIRARTAPTIVRELDAALHDPAIGLEQLARVRVPVLQLIGSASNPRFRAGAVALDERLATGRIATIDGARHAAHHSHPAAFAEAVAGFAVR